MIQLQNTLINLDKVQSIKLDEEMIFVFYTDQTSACFEYKTSNQAYAEHAAINNKVNNNGGNAIAKALDNIASSIKGFTDVIRMKAF